MKNTIAINKNRVAAFYPCGLRIPQDQIFASARNLGLSLMGALTGIPTEYLQINRSEISIGLGCFGLVYISCLTYEEGCSVEALDEDDSWLLTSNIGYELYDNHACTGDPFATFDMLFLNISPEQLLRGNGDNFDAIQLFGPSRLLRKLKSDDNHLEVCRNLEMNEILNWLDGDEINNAILTPSREEFDLYYNTADPQERFRVLLNMITTFVSTLSVKLTYWGHVRASSIGLLSNDAQKEVDWFKDKRMGPKWKPPMSMIKKCMKEYDIKETEVCSEIRRLIWPKGKTE